MRKIKKIIVHCSDSEFGNANRIKEWHLERGWADIGYHFVINNGFVFKNDNRNDKVQNGFIETGRSLSKAGAHVSGHNADSVGICLIGKRTFTDEQIEGSINLILGLLEEYKLTPNNVYGHYEFDKGKSCPNIDMKLYRERLQARYSEYKSKAK